MSKEVTLCVSNAYQKKFYLNENFNGLPQSIREELKIMCVLYTEDVGGILELVFDEDGSLQFGHPVRKVISSTMRLEACSKSNSTRTKKGICLRQLRRTIAFFIWARAGKIWRNNK